MYHGVNKLILVVILAALTLSVVFAGGAEELSAEKLYLPSVFTAEKAIATIISWVEAGKVVIDLSTLSKFQLKTVHTLTYSKTFSFRPSFLFRKSKQLLEILP